MNEVQLAQLKAMSQSQRLGYYFKKLVTGQITREQYEKAIRFAASLPSPVEDTPTHQEGTLVVASDGESGDWTNGANGERPVPLDVSESGRGQPCETPTREQSGDEMERTSSVSLPTSTDGAHPDRRKGMSQKDRIIEFLSDGNWHTTPEIQTAVYGANHLGSAAIPSRVAELNKPKKIIESRPVTRGIWKYRMIPDDSIAWITQNITSG